MTTIREALDQIGRPVPPKLVSDKVVHKKSGTKASFISWYDACDLMDERCGGWQSEIRKVGEIGGSVYVTVRVSLICEDGLLFREATGTDDEPDSNYGSPLDRAEAAALRRAFAKMGLARELYGGTGAKIRHQLIAKRQNGGDEQTPQRPAQDVPPPKELAEPPQEEDWTSVSIPSGAWAALNVDQPDGVSTLGDCTLDVLTAMTELKASTKAARAFVAQAKEAKAAVEAQMFESDDAAA